MTSKQRAYLKSLAMPMDPIPVSYTHLFAQKAYTRLMEKCGFTKIPWRKLRNTYATILAEFEISMKAIAASLGHYSADFTQEIYVNTERVVYLSLIHIYWSNWLRQS